MNLEFHKLRLFFANNFSLMTTFIQSIWKDAKIEESLYFLGAQFDLLFIDATKEEYLSYLDRAEKYLAKGAVVIADNIGIYENQMLDFLEYVRNQGRYKSQTIETRLEFTDDIRDAIELSIKIV